MSCSSSSRGVVAAIVVIIRNQQSCWPEEVHLSCFWAATVYQSCFTYLPIFPPCLQKWKFQQATNKIVIQVTYHVGLVVSIKADDVKEHLQLYIIPPPPPSLSSRCINCGGRREIPSAAKSPQIPLWLRLCWAREQLALPQTAEDFSVISVEVS